MMRLLLLFIIILSTNIWLPRFSPGNNGNLVSSFMHQGYSSSSLYKSCLKSQVKLDRRRSQNNLPRRRHNPISTRLFEFGQDDLPNLLGINPIEATVLFVFAYYFLGPEKLYEYAREAGKLFSTYFPILRQGITDIIYEFRDFLEEDRERSLLVKAGIDVTRLPRKTTNVFERLQKSFEAMGEMTDAAMTSSATSSSSNTRSVTSTEVDEEIPVLVKEKYDEKRRRKTKKEVMRESNAEPLSLTENTLLEESRSAKSGSEEMNDDVDDETLAKASPVYDELLHQQSLSVTASPAELSTSLSDMAESFSPSPPPALTPAMSKFQQQLSGEWNQKILRREKYDEPAPSPYLPSSSSTTSSFPFPSFEDLDDEDSAYPMNEDKVQEMHMTDDIPDELSAEIKGLTTSSFPPLRENDENKTAREGLEMLKQFDEDYLKLRSKLLRFIQDQQSSSS